MPQNLSAEEVIDLLESIVDTIRTFFKDQYQSAHMSYLNDNHSYCNIPIASSQFREYITNLCYSEYGQLPSDAVLKKVESICAYKASQGPQWTLHNRIATNKDMSEITYNLNNKEGEVVVIDKDGWKIEENKNTMFRNYPHQTEQIKAEEGGDIQDLLQVLNIKEPHQKVLYLSWLASCFLPHISHPILYLYGTQGSCKSTITRLTRDMVDPSIIENMELGTDPRELIQLVEQNYVCPIDNCSYVDHKLSDTLCKIVTGSSFSKRKLYTDSDSITYKFKRIIMLNGINMVFQQPDLLERTILMELSPIKERKTEEFVDQTIMTIKPRILGTIFSAISHALANRDRIPQENLPRMADWFSWSSLLAEGLGFTQKEFRHAFDLNTQEQNYEVLQESPLAKVLLSYLEDNDISEVEFSASGLLYELEKERGYSDFAKFPKTPNKLSQEMSKLETNLKHEGVTFMKYRDSKGNRKIKIKYQKPSSVPSTVKEENGNVNQ